MSVIRTDGRDDGEQEREPLHNTPSRARTGNLESPLAELRRVIFIAAGRKLTAEEVGGAHRATAEVERLFAAVIEESRTVALDSMAHAAGADRKVDELKAAVLAALGHECPDYEY